MRKTLKILAVSIVSGLAMAFVPLARAQRTTAPVMPDNARFGNPNGYARNYQDYLYGVITKVDASALVLDKTKFGIPETIRLIPKTKYVFNGKKSSLKQLKPGDMVYVQVKKDKKSGDLTAKKVVSGMGATPGV
jgi:hypothetical protein